MAGLTLTIELDSSAVVADLALLQRAAERSVDVRKRLLDLLDLAPQLVCIDRQAAPASPADQHWVRLQMAKPFAVLLAAVRAGHFGDLVVEERVHG